MTGPIGVLQGQRSSSYSQGLAVTETRSYSKLAVAAAWGVLSELDWTFLSVSDQLWLEFSETLQYIITACRNAPYISRKPRSVTRRLRW